MHLITFISTHSKKGVFALQIYYFCVFTAGNSSLAKSHYRQKHRICGSYFKVVLYLKSVKLFSKHFFSRTIEPIFEDIRGYSVDN